MFTLLRNLRIASAGQLAFAVVMIALGIKGVPAGEALAYVCALVSLASGVGLLWKRTAASAARVLLGYLLAWALLFRVPVILRAPAEFLPWDGGAETAVMVAGAWALFARLATDRDRRFVGFAAGERGVRIARVLNGLAMIAFGLAHFAYLEHTAELVPRWLPAQLFWAKCTGWTFLAAGAGMLFGMRARLAAALATLQIGLFTLLVWVPILAAGSKDASQWMEFATSAALTAGAWVVAESFR
jgi:uncharacterized membrane protein